MTGRPHAARKFVAGVEDEVLDASHFSLPKGRDRDAGTVSFSPIAIHVQRGISRVCSNLPLRWKGVEGAIGLAVGTFAPMLLNIPRLCLFRAGHHLPGDSKANSSAMPRNAERARWSVLCFEQPRQGQERRFLDVGCPDLNTQQERTRGRVLLTAHSGTGWLMAFTLRSSAFEDGEMIPRQFTCDGNDFAPPLAWSDAPEGTRSFALVMEDPDAPHGTFTHWLLYDIPATTTELREHVGGKALRNSFGRAEYGGPCPPAGDGPHRYVFTLYALDVSALDMHGRTRQALERSLHVHTLVTARLMGRYERKSER